MNRYTLNIKTNFKNEVDEWKFIVIAEDTSEYVTSVILEVQKEFNFESPVELMDYVCDTYDWKWEDFDYDIEIEM